MSTFSPAPAASPVEDEPPLEMNTKKADMTVREVDEAAHYNLTVNSYLELRQKIVSRLEAHLEKKLRNAYLPKVRVEIANELRAQITQEVQSDLLSESDRRSYREYLREAEMDALAAATAASSESEVWFRGQKRIRQFGLPMAFAWLFSTPIGAYYLYTKFGFTPGFFAFLAPFLVGAVATLVRLYDNLEESMTKGNLLRKQASEFLRLASVAKENRTLLVETKTTRKDLDQDLSHFRLMKSQLASEYRPNLANLAAARLVARDTLMSEMDPEKIFRVADPRAEEFEALEEPSRAKEKSK